MNQFILSLVVLASCCAACLKPLPGKGTSHAKAGVVRSIKPLDLMR